MMALFGLAGGGVARAETAAGNAAPAAKGEAAEAAPAEAAGADAGGGLFEQSVAASEGGTKEAASSAAAPPSFTLNGYVRGDVFAGKVPNERAGEIKADYGELSLSLRTAKSAYGDGFAETRLRYGMEGADSQTIVDVREAYVNTYLGPLDLRLGKQIIVWGRADALNPTNNLTPVDFQIRSPLEDDIRVGNVGARANLRFAPFRLEAVWMPLYQATQLPNVGLPDFVSFGKPTYPSADLRNGLAAGRLHLELASFEMSFSYLRGYAPMPGLTLTSVTFDEVNPSVVVSRTAYDHQVVGFDFSTALGAVLTLRGEAAYRRPYDYKDRPYAARPDAQYVLGVDHNFGSLSVIAQYMGRYVFDWQLEPGPSMTLDPSILKTPSSDPNYGVFMTNAPISINQQLAKTSQILFSQTAKVQHIGTLRLEWLGAHEALSLSSLALYNFTTKEWLITPRIGYHLSDAMMVYLGAQVFAGPRDTLFGLINAVLSAGYAELRYSF
ncbi:MAG TPA: DUF1302 family protein [Polyangia bacterium]